jgi:hypothetical protein
MVHWLKIINYGRLKDSFMPANKIKDTNWAKTALVLSNTKSWIRENAVQVTAGGYAVGHLLEGLTGIANAESGIGSPFERQMASSCLLTGMVTMGVFGKKDIGIATALTIDQLGFYFATRQGMLDGRMGIIAGFACNAAAMGFAWATRPLEKKFNHYRTDLIDSTKKLQSTGTSPDKILHQRFKECGAALVRNTLGKPRVLMATALSLSNVPWIIDAVGHKQWAWLGVVSCYAVSDAFMFLARSENHQNKPTIQLPSDTPAYSYNSQYQNHISNPLSSRARMWVEHAQPI